MVLKGYPRISETFISNEIQLLEEQGLRIHIFSMRRPRESFSHASVKRITARVTYLPESLFWGLPSLIRANVRLLHETPAIWRAGVRLLLKRYSGAPKKHTWLKHFLQAGCMVAAMRDLARNGQPVGHIHAHFAHTPTSVALYAARMSGVPFSFTAHAKDIYTQQPSRLLAKMRQARFVITCTRYNREHLETLVRTMERLEDAAFPPMHTVYHGIDLSLFAFHDPRIVVHPPYNILTVARLVRKKGVPTVLRALRLLQDRGIDFVHTLVGSGSDRRPIQAFIRELGLQDQVRLTGTITHEEVVKLYGKADLFVLGCREAEDGDRDGIPNVVAEALAMGVPVAATNISGLPELVRHGQTGLLAPCDDAASLAANMERLLTDRDLRSRVIAAGRKRVEEVFDNRVLTQHLAEVYWRDSGLAGPRRGTGPAS
ncbi:MAG: colanic acid biosynthesis glycosyltransferase WcaL [Desulfovibrionales bacterium]|nr:MAG: colanic acid biosynthesis glycosyltransferase WcaL [Desulfovibrionales bacterium]